MSEPSLISSAHPSAAPSVPSVVISGGTFSLAMQNPLNRPQATPHARDTIVPAMTVHQLSAIPSIIFPATSPENTRIEPIEMSNPPPTITKVMPTAMICNIATSRVIVRKLAMVGKASGRRMLNTTTSPRSTQPM